MTDSRLPDSWLLNPVLDKFSHEAWRLLTRALMFCNQQGTDGEIELLYLRHIWPWGDSSPYVMELIESGWLEQTDAGFVIPDWEDKGQSPASQVAVYREKARLRQQKSRTTKRASETRAVTSDVTRDVTRDVGKATQGSATHGEASEMRESWPVVEIPTPDSNTKIQVGEIL